MRLTWRRIWLVLIVTLLLSGCAVVSVRQDSERGTIDDATLAVVGGYDFSADTRAVLGAIGRRPERCRADLDACARALAEVANITGDHVQASLAELYLAMPPALVAPMRTLATSARPE